VSALDVISELAARPFASREEAVEAVLDVLHYVPGLRTAFVARTNRGLFEVVAADNRQGCPVNVGDELPLEDSY
jgi:hypothetical protein